MLSWLRRERGQELVEYALILPLLFVLIFGIAQAALVILSYNTIDDAARQGARLGVIADNADYPDRIRAAVYQVTDAAGMRSGESDRRPHQTRQTRSGSTVTYDMPLIVWVFGSARITLRAVSTKLIELQ